MVPEPHTQHYFVTDSSLPQKPRQLSVDLHGHTVQVHTAAGVFSPTALDKGTAALLRNVPPPTGRHFLDIGCGWGPLTLAMGLSDPEATVTAVDVNDRSLDLTRRNAQAHGLHGVETYRPEDVPEQRRFDTVWSNPPIRVGKQALHEILLTWLPRLAPGGTAWLVVQKNLGGDSLQRWLAETLDDVQFTVDRAATDKGFRILRVQRTPEAAAARAPGAIT